MSMLYPVSVIAGAIEGAPPHPGGARPSGAAKFPAEEDMAETIGKP